MRIVIDMQGAQTDSRFRGIGRYTISMTQALLSQQTEHEIFLAFNGLMPESIASVRQTIGSQIKDEHILIWHAYGPLSDADGRNTWRRRVAEACYKTFLKDLQADLLFISSYFEGYRDDALACVAEPEFGFATCVVVYDLIPLLNAEQYFNNSVFEKHYTRKLREIQSAAGALTISEFSRDEALEHLSFRPDQIVNTYLGADAQFRPLSLDAAQRQARMREFDLDRPFVLYTGGSDERKNLPRLLEAFAALPPSLRQKHQLLLAGKFSSLDLASLQQLGLSLELGPDALRFTGYVSDEALIELYNLCTLFVFPSWHEGFGLPVLEAMACGAPALAAHRTSLPEVLAYEDALFDPFDVYDIRDKIAKFLNDEHLRTALVEHSLVQARQFSWDASAKKAMAQFDRILQQQPTRSHQTRAEVEASLLSCYQNLIAHIAKLSVDDKGIKDHDLRAVARCIEVNQTEARRVRCQVLLSDKSHWFVESSHDMSAAVETEASIERLKRALTACGRRLVKERAQADVSLQTLPLALSTGPGPELQCSYGLRLGRSAAPDAWVLALNQFSRGVIVESKQIKKSLVDSGVYVPIRVCQASMEDWLHLAPAPFSCDQSKSYRFIADFSDVFDVKSAGLDVLLASYGAAFQAADDVTLRLIVTDALITDVQACLSNWQRVGENLPHVVVIDVKDEALSKSIYLQAHCLVMPYRYEDVGTAVARSASLGLPVLTTAWGGQVEVASASQTRMIDYTFSRTQDTTGQLGLYWVEPDHKQLSALMRAQFLSGGDREAERLVMSTKRSWANVAQEVEHTVQAWALDPVLRRPCIGWISTWNARCGIAKYSEYLIEQLPESVTVFAPRNVEQNGDDDAQVVRCWDVTHDALTDLSVALQKHGINALVIQFNYGFFEFSTFSAFLSAQVARQVKIIVTLHSTTDLVKAPDRRLVTLIPALTLCHRVLVHSTADLNRLKSLGLIHNVALFPHGMKDVPSANVHTKKRGSKPSRRSESKPFLIATYGFFLPHKGLLEMVDVISLLRGKGCNVMLHMINAEYPIEESAALVRQVRTKISTLGLSKYIRLTTDFLADEESLAHLSQADLIVYPYQETGESSSGAVRFGLGSMRPVAVTPLAIFEDVDGAVYRLPGVSSTELAQGLKSLLEDLGSGSHQTVKTAQFAQAWCLAHRYSELSTRLLSMLKAPN